LNGSAVDDTRRILAAAALLGAVTVLAFAPFGLAPIAPLGLAMLSLAWMRARRARTAAAIGYAYGVGLYATGVHWLYISLHDIGGMPAPLAVGAVVGLAAVLAVYPALAGAALHRLCARRPRIAILALPALWTLCEWLRGTLFTGFPWLTLGYAEIPSGTLAGFAPVGGVYAVTFALAMGAAGIALAVRERQWRWLVPVAAIACVGLALQWPDWTVPRGAPMTASLLQGNIAQDLKFRQEELERTLETYRKLVRASRARLVVTPESAMPVVLDDLPTDYLDELTAHVRGQGGDLLLGAFVQDESGRYYNSMVNLGTSPRQTYRKHHLVPFGEYVPLRPLIGWIVDRAVAIPMSDQESAPDHPRPIRIGEQTIDIDICYEDVFGQELLRNLPRATLLINVSNDAWFGGAVGPHQHLQIAQTRALETGRPMLRATNTGISAIVDARGRISARAPQFVTTSLDGTVRGYVGSTPYVRVGDAGALTVAVLCLAAALALARAGRSPPADVASG
jgi:apolipoprotein N-acyltransferase